MSVLKQISIPDQDTWTIKHVNELTKTKTLSPTVIRALKFYDEYQHLIEDDGTLPGLVDMIKELQSQVKELNSKVENMKFVSSTKESNGPEVNSDDWLAELEGME